MHRMLRYLNMFIIIPGHEPDPVPKCRELWNTDLLCMENVWKNRGSYVVESEVESGKIYRPMEGMASLKSRSVLNYKNAMWNGRKTAVTHE